jgi:zinc protease
MPLASIDHYVADVDAVTPAQVQAAAQATLDPARTDIVIAGDASLFYDQLHAARPNAERIAATDLNLDSASLH